MPQRRWKARSPQSMQEAIRTCLDYAEYKNNRSTKRIADLNGVSEWSIYKWMHEGSIPSRRIAPFELACECHYVTHYLAHSAHKLLIDVLTGRVASPDDLLDLQTELNDVVRHLRRYFEREADGDVVIGAVTRAMSALAGHRANVDRAAKTNSAELALFDEGES